MRSALLPADAIEQAPLAPTLLQSLEPVAPATKDLQNHAQRSKILQEQLNFSDDETRRLVYKAVAEHTSQMLRAMDKKYTTDDFEPLLILGEGGFGVVHLVQRREVSPPQFCALKQMPKSKYDRKNARDRIFAERHILSEARSRWFVRLFATFQDSHYVYMAMEFVQGGDLFKYLEMRHRLNMREGQFYIAELLLALEVVHDYGFIHRDIKPDNIILTSSGHLKLLDFGLCKVDPSKKACQSNAHNGSARSQDARLRMSLAGTPTYMAPESFEQYFSALSDLWAAAVVLFECLFGAAPFYTDSAFNGKRQMDDIRSQVQQCDEILQSKYKSGLDRGLFSAELVDLLKNLLCAEETRFSIQQCKQHRFFTGIDFDTIHLSVAPICPNIKGPSDTRYFDVKDPVPLPAAEPDFVDVDPKLEWENYEFNGELHVLRRPSVFKEFIASVIESSSRAGNEGGCGCFASPLLNLASALGWRAVARAKHRH